jgi:hypothetical protein
VPLSPAANKYGVTAKSHPELAAGDWSYVPASLELATSVASDGRELPLGLTEERERTVQSHAAAFSEFCFLYSGRITAAATSTGSSFDRSISRAILGEASNVPTLSGVSVELRDETKASAGVCGWAS